MKINSLSPEQAILKELAERLGRLRKQQGLSQERLAQEAGIGVATLRRIEDGQDSQLSSWLKLMKALGMSAAIERFLPEQQASPMEEVLAGRKPTRKNRTVKKPAWGDEQA